MTCPKGIKLCQDCEWHKEKLYGNNGEYDDCVCPKNLTDNSTCFVTGKLSYMWSTCCSCREMNHEDSCGPEARWFEPKKVKWWNPLTW
jgi:hypothetical protein